MKRPLPDETLIAVLRGISLSDHLRDVGRAIKPLLDYFELKVSSLDDLYRAIETRNLTAPKEPGVKALSPEAEPREIGRIANDYGGLIVKREGEKCYWAIVDFDGPEWEEIPRSLFEELNRFQDTSEAAS